MVSNSQNSGMSLVCVRVRRAGRGDACTHSLSITRQVTASAAITFAVLTSSLYENRKKWK